MAVNGSMTGGWSWRIDNLGGIRSVTLSVPANDWWVSLSLCNPSVAVRGPWRIEVLLPRRP